MVHNPAVVYVPSLARLSSHKKAVIAGRGTTLLLNQGGSGAASTYPNIDDYIKQTGRNPLVSGSGLGRKLEALSLGGKPTKPRAKNIKFNL